MTDQAEGLSSRDVLRQECWKNAIYAFGTSHIFQRRLRRIRKRLQWLTYSGIVLPLLIGAVVLSFGVDLPGLPVLIAIAALLLIAQLAVSAWSIVAGWVDQLAHASDSAITNERLSRQYAELGRNPPSGGQFRVAYDLVRADDQNQRQLDLRQHLSDKEERRGMRAALRQFRRACDGCGKVPASLRPTECDICGNY